MAVITPDKFVTGADLQYMVGYEGIFDWKFGYPGNLPANLNKLLDKIEVQNAVQLNVGGSEWTELANNQWVARWRMTPISNPNPNPSTPTLTTVYNTLVTNYDDYWVRHTWTQSNNGVTQYQIRTRDSAGNILEDGYITYGPGTQTSGNQYVDQGIGRDCTQYSFQIRAMNTTTGANSGWSNITYATMQTDYPFFSTLYTSATAITLGWTLEGQNPVSHAMTNNGQNIYQIQDNGNGTTANIKAHPVVTPYDVDSINSTITFSDEQVSTSSNVVSAFISDDGKHVIWLRPYQSISYSFNTGGWSTNMNFVYQTGRTLTDLPGSSDTVTDIKLSENYLKMFISTQTTIYEYTLSSAWNIASATLTASIDLASLISLPVNHDFQQITDISFVDSGLGLLVRYEYLLTTDPSRDVRYRQVAYIECTGAFNINILTNTIHDYDQGSLDKFGSYNEGGTLSPFFHVYPLKGIQGAAQTGCEQHAVIDSVDGLDLHTLYNYRTVKRR